MKKLPTLVPNLESCANDTDHGDVPVRAEAAFTLIEMLIALVLTVIACGTVSMVLIHGFQSSSDARAGGVSDAAIRRTTEALQDDVGRAATADTRSGDVRDDTMLADAVRTGAAAYRPFRDANGVVDPAKPLVPADIDDIRVATPTEVQLIVGNECITWRAGRGTLDGRATFDITRSVAPATNCGATTDTRRFVSAGPGADTTPFSFRLLCSRVQCPGSAAPSTAPCRPWTVETAVTGHRRRWIVGVDISFASLTQSNRGVGAGRTTVSAGIRAREVERYREALGC